MLTSKKKTKKKTKACRIRFKEQNSVEMEEESSDPSEMTASVSHCVDSFFFFCLSPHVCHERLSGDLTYFIA